MVSVIVPVYNTEKYVRRCLDCILRQTFQDMQIILVDDGSEDGSLSILQSYAERDRRITLITQRNQGVSAARNVGLRKATGEYILFVDSDDWMEEGMLEKMMHLMRPDVDIVFCAHDNAETPEDVRQETIMEYELWDHGRQMFEFMKHKRMTGMVWNKLIKRPLTEGIFFNEATGYGEDAEFLWKVIKKAQTMAVTNEVLYHHVVQKDSISHLSFSEKKYSAIPMWEQIVADVEQHYPELLPLAVERLMSAAVCSGYEMKKAGYKNKEQQKHIQDIVRKHLKSFLRSAAISKKMKFFAVAISGGVLTGKLV